MGYSGPQTRASPLIVPHTRSHGRSNRSSASSSVSSDSRSSDGRKQRSSSSMKCIISVGIILPILAAVIGVVAWAVSSDAIYPKDTHSRLHASMFHTGGGGGGFNDPFIPQIQDRSDLDFHSDVGKLPIGAGVPKEAVGLVKEDEDDPESPSLTHQDNIVNGDNPVGNSGPGGNSKGDPLYIVHYVPQKGAKPDIVSTTPSTTTHSAEAILSKILSSSKGASKGTPQFVVFAPLPGESPVPSQLGPSKNSPSDEDTEKEEEEEEEEVEERPRPKKTSRKRKGSKKKVAPVVHDDDSESGESYPSPRVPEQVYSQPLPNVPPQYSPQGYQGYAVNQPQQQQPYSPPQQHPHNYQQYPQPPQQPPVQGYPPSQGMYPPQRYGHYDQAASGSSHIDSPIARQSDAQYPPPENDQQQDSHRLGHLGIGVGVPKGVTVHVGGGKGILPLSPLGFLRTLILPLLPKPKVNLNQKVFFGVQLDKGIGFGGNKGHK